MTHPVYSQQSLSELSPAAVKVIAKAIGIEKPAFRKDACIAQILEHQSNAIAPAAPAPRTCATCPYFASRMDGTDKGWCHLFDVFARSTHPETQDCINQGGEVEGVEPINTEATEWETAQSEVLEVLEEQVRLVAPEMVESIEEDGYTVTTLHTGDILLSSPNVYMVPSASQAGVRYRVDLYRRTCTCKAGSYGNPCRHIKQAEQQSDEDFKLWQESAAKVPVGWRYKDGWWMNHHGHRQNTAPVSLSPRELATLVR